MRTATAGIVGLIAGILTATYCRRYFGAFVWWLFTADVRAKQ